MKIFIVFVKLRSVENSMYTEGDAGTAEPTSWISHECTSETTGMLSTRGVP
jgi:hypothetical protein